MAAYTLGPPSPFVFPTRILKDIKGVGIKKINADPGRFRDFKGLKDPPGLYLKDFKTISKEVPKYP